MRAIVFANGRLPDIAAHPLVAKPGDLIIAADGGARNCRAHGLVPDVVVGDFDSLPEAELAALAAAGAEVVGHPARKDHTDLDLALQLAVARGADEVLVHGALGRRWDMTLANVLLGMAPHLAGARIGFVDERQVLWPLRGGSTLRLTGRRGDTVSLIPLCGDAQGVTTSGLEWPLTQDTLTYGTTRGVSNALTGDAATIALDQGLLLCVHTQSSAVEGEETGMRQHMDRWQCLAAAVAVAGLGAGCRAAPTPAPVETPSGTTAASSVNSETPAALPFEGQTLRVMTHDSFAASDAVLATFEAQTGAKLQFLQSGDAGSALNKAILSADAPLADVFYGVDNTFLSRALEADVFEPYDSPMLAEISARF